MPAVPAPTRTSRLVATHLSTLRAIAAAGFVSSQIGTAAPVRYISAVLVVLILAPTATHLTRISFGRLATITACLFVASVLGAGGLMALALMTYLIVLPAGRALGSTLFAKAVDRVAISATIAATQWVPIVLQYRNPALVLDRLTTANQVTSTSLNALERAQGLRPVGTTVSPGIVVVILLTGVVLASVGSPRRTSASLALWVLGAGHLTALALTGSRTGLAGAAILVALQFNRAGGGHVLIRRVIRLALIPFGAFAIYLISLGSTRVSAASRLDILAAAAPILRRHWVSGIGWGRTPDYVTTAADGTVYHLHLTPVHVLFELGAMGLLACVLYVVRLVLELGPIVAFLSPFFITDAGTFINVTAVFFLGVILGVLHAHHCAARAVADRARESAPGGTVDLADRGGTSESDGADTVGVRVPRRALVARYHSA
ncbi:MAG: hypothetical protein IPJ14_23555 [Kineosporiaceae bacterium]|nr:hypothetical protein [Kineosporiaceae bacterium]